MNARRLPWVVALVGGVTVVTLAGQTPATDPAAAAMAAKLDAIVERGLAPAPTSRQVRTSFTDREVNAYFRESGPLFLPEGVTDPQVHIEAGNRVRARAIVDLDAALRPQERSALDPLAWLGGQVEVTASGTLQTSGGRGLFALEHATLGGVSIPRQFLQEVVSYYSRSEELPRGFRLDEPFDLPSGIRAVELRTGLATVIQ